MASKMAADLSNQITKEFGGEALNQIASVIGETPAKAQSALGSLVPAVLGSLAGKASTTEGANDVIDLIRKNNLTSVDVNDIYRPGAATNLANTGRSVVDSLFGGKLSSLTDWIAGNAGINHASVTSLATLAVPTILGLIGRRLGPSGLNASSLSNLLGGPNKYLQGMPAGLVSALGLGGAATAARRFADDSAGRVVAAPAYATQKPSSVWKWLLPLLLLAGLVGLVSYLFSRRQGPATVTTPQVATAPVTAAPNPPAPVAPATTSEGLGAFLDKALPNGVTLHIPSNGVESKLLAFIGDPTKPVDKDTWFSFDRLEFETDSATLKSSSREQLANVAAILKSYPQVTLKIGGYTDNTGDPSHNLKLSQGRATSTVNELVSMGVAKSRLAAEGYGQQFPVADNATPEGRQRNRRIDVRVTQK
jgi:outer membrane protein OmpA-like peptidoglycan-associated protein